MQLPVVTAHPRPAPSSAPVDAPLFDGEGRRITYLRLSVTDRCNFRCVYCSPSNWAGRAKELTPAEFVRLASLFVRMGVDRIRLTGGEPLVRDDLVDIARALKNLPGLRELCLTTNGHRLAELALPLRDAGVDVINVSLDTMRADAFHALTKTGDLERVVKGLQAASSAGFRRLAINAVVLAGQNDSPDDLAAVARFAWSVGAVPRFIELMPFAGEGDHVPTRVVVERLESLGLSFTIAPTRAGAGPANYRLASDPAGVGGEIGFIGAMTENFCDRCNRVRLSASGELRACLGGREQVPLSDLIRGGAPDEELSGRIRAALSDKGHGHRFVEDGSAGLLPMMGIGG